MRFFLQNTGSNAIKLVFLLLLIVLGAHVEGFSQVPKSVDSSGTTNNLDSIANMPSNRIELSKDSITFRQVPDSTIARFKKNKDFAYANDPEFLKKEPVDRGRGFGYYLLSFIASKWARAIIYILMAAALCYAFYKTVITNKFYLFYSSPKKSIVPEGSNEDIYKGDFDIKINGAFELHNYRLAIRYMYLKSLKLLDLAGTIELNAHGTNEGYELQLRGTKFSKDFKYLTQVYEYIWYGGFTISKIHAENITEKFQSFYLSIQA
jgi:hypothetical protein